MNRKMIWIALAALLLPILARAIWFYPGFTTRTKVTLPNYVAMTMPVPTMETPQPNDKTSIKYGVVVFDGLHADQYQRNEIQALTDALESRGANVEFDAAIGTLETRLKYASAYVVISPSIEFTPDELRIVQAFVEHGGRLIVFTDATRGQYGSDFFTGADVQYSDANLTNPLLAPYGITVNGDYLYNLTSNEGNFRNVFFDQFGKNALTYGLKLVTLYGTHSVRAESGMLLLSSSDKTFSSLNDAHDDMAGGAALSADGNVLAFGDFTFLASPYNQVTDNANLIANIADFMLGGTRKHALADFPYVFNSNAVKIFPTSDVQITPELVGPLSRLQTGLKYLNIDSQITNKAPAGGNTIVLGTFTPTDDLLPFLEPFNITLDETSDTIDLPGFGKVARTGNAILLYETGNTGNTLIMLADTTADLNYLLDSATGGSLYGCVIQNNLGVCGVGSSDYSYYETPAPDYLPTEVPTELPPLEITPTPTPAG